MLPAAFISALTAFLSAAKVEAADCQVSAVAASCGHPVVQPAAARVVGGREALVGSWPWIVSVVEKDHHVCGGAIIGDKVILTATHCITELNSFNASNWRVVAGKHHLLKTDRGQMSFPVQRIILHEDYDGLTLENDIALLVLRETIPQTTFIRPICLPSGSADTALWNGKACLMAGWGSTKGTAADNVLNQVTVPVISDAVCGGITWYYDEFIPQKTFCAGYEEGERDACEGDSGGPLISIFGDRWYVVGVASWGYGCGEQRWPGIYTNVTHYLPWIHSQLEGYDVHIACSTAPVG